MLTMRKRGKAQNYYIRGSVTLGNRTEFVPEYSTGTNCRDTAAFIMAKQEQELRERLMFGPRAATVSATIAEALSAYLKKPEKPNSSDVIRVGNLNEAIGHLTLANPHEAWETMREKHLFNHMPAGQDRYRSVLQAAIKRPR